MLFRSIVAVMGARLHSQLIEILIIFGGFFLLYQATIVLMQPMS